MKLFLGFVFISGLGWVCDFITFTLLVSLFDLPSFISNFVSSYVGVTFVWFTSLRTIFDRKNAARTHHLFFYWGFQLLSILTYSKLLQLLVSYIAAVDLLSAHAMSINIGVVGKIMITPINLITNFIFMKVLTHHMHKQESTHV